MSSAVHFIAGLPLTPRRILMVMDAIVAPNWLTYKHGEINMRCPCCGEADLVSETRDIKVTYKRQTTVIPAVEGDYCPACGEVVLSRESGNKYSDLLEAFHRQVDEATSRGDYRP